MCHLPVVWWTGQFYSQFCDTVSWLFSATFSPSPDPISACFEAEFLSISMEALLSLSPSPDWSETTKPLFCFRVTLELELPNTNSRGLKTSATAASPTAFLCSHRTCQMCFLSGHLLRASDECENGFYHLQQWPSVMQSVRTNGQTSHLQNIMAALCQPPFFSADKSNTFCPTSNI